VSAAVHCSHNVYTILKEYSGLNMSLSSIDIICGMLSITTENISVRLSVL